MKTLVTTCFRIDAAPADVDLVDQAMSCFDAACAGRLAPSDLVDTALPDPKESGSRMAGLRRAMEGHLGKPLGLILDRTETGATISGEGDLNMSAMAELLRVLLPAILPVRILWSARTVPLTPEGTIGGWLVIHLHEVVAGDAVDAAASEIARVARRKEPTELQLRLAEANKPHDDGHLAMAIEDERGPIEDHLRSQNHGDTLSAFMYMEVGDAGDDEEEAVRMLRSAAEQLEAVAQALEGI